jgi:Mn2+/Fe2+ NRAMP family transporter
MCARLGAATGRGLLDLIRERFGLTPAVAAVGVVLLANGAVVVTEFVGVGAAAELFGVSRYLAVPAAAVLVGYLVTAGHYARVEKLFLAMALVFLAYPAAAVLAGPDWGAVARGALVPTLRPDPEYLFLLVGTVGTTLTPYMLLFQQSAVVEKGVARREYGPERVDTLAGAVFSNLVAACIVVATAATLHLTGQTEVETAADAARALEPVAGPAARGLFAVGLLGASLLAAGVLPLTTAYSVSEAFGFRKGVDLDFRRAPVFITVFAALVAGGAAVALLPGLPLVRLLVGVQVLNGVLLPVVLLFVLLMAGDRRLATSLTNGRLSATLGWATLLLVAAAVLTLFGARLLEAVAGPAAG